MALYADGAGRGEEEAARALDLLVLVAGRLLAAGVRLVSFQDAMLERALREGSRGPWIGAAAGFLGRWDRAAARLWLPPCEHPLPPELAAAATPFRERPATDERAVVFHLGLGGKEDILRAARRLAAGGGKAHPTREHFEAGLSTAGLPDPDLVILTGARPALPDFLLYQISYSELYLTGAAWESFTLRDLEAALQSFRRRERRYGRVT